MSEINIVLKQKKLKTQNEQFVRFLLLFNALTDWTNSNFL